MKVEQNAKLHKLTTLGTGGPARWFAKPETVHDLVELLTWAESQASRVLRLLLARGCPRWAYWNVNLPHISPNEPDPQIVFCPLDPSPLPADFRMEGDLAIYSGVYQARPRRPGGDVDVCFGGRIAATLIRLDGHPAESTPADASRTGETTPSALGP